MSGVTSLAVLPVTVEHGEDSPGLRVTGGDYRSPYEGSQDGVSLEAGLAPHAPVASLDEALTSIAPPESLPSTVESLRLGLLTPPTELQGLLTQAVASSQARQSEDVGAWAQRVADEAAREDQ